MGNEQTTLSIDKSSDPVRLIATAVGAITGTAEETNKPDLVGLQALQAAASPFALLQPCLAGPAIPWWLDPLFMGPTIPLDLVYSVFYHFLKERLQKLFSSSSSGDGIGHFILVLFFTAWRAYIATVIKALEDETKRLPAKVFIPGGSIHRTDWDKLTLTVYVFGQYGNYIDQKHMLAHKGLILVYLDQSGQSKNLVLHRLDLSAEKREEQEEKLQSNYLGGIPTFEYAEEFYFRAMMKSARQESMPAELVNILKNSQPSEMVAAMLKFDAGLKRGMDPLAMSNAFLNFVSQDFSSGSSGSSGSNRENLLTEMLHIRENMMFEGMDSFPFYEGTLDKVSLHDLWLVIQNSMRIFPKTYSVVSANCIQFCGEILEGFKKRLDMKKNLEDPVLQDILKPIKEAEEFLVKI